MWQTQVLPTGWVAVNLATEWRGRTYASEQHLGRDTLINIRLPSPGWFLCLSIWWAYQGRIRCLGKTPRQTGSLNEDKFSIVDLLLTSLIFYTAMTSLLIMESAIKMIRTNYEKVVWWAYIIYWEIQSK